VLGGFWRTRLRLEGRRFSYLIIEFRICFSNDIGFSRFPWWSTYFSGTSHTASPRTQTRKGSESKRRSQLGRIYLIVGDTIDCFLLILDDLGWFVVGVVGDNQLRLEIFGQLPPLRGLGGDCIVFPPFRQQSLVLWTRRSPFHFVRCGFGPCLMVC